MKVFFFIYHLLSLEKWAFTLRGALVAGTPPLNMFTLLHKISGVCFLFFFLLQSNLCLAAPPFPLYPVIDNNVRFWETIYGRYSTSQAVVHDSYNLGIVYEVIPIFNHKIPGSSQFNKPLFKKVRKKYVTILNKLAEGITPVTIEEKRIASLFGRVSPKRFREAANSVRIQVGQKDRFLEGVIRSGAYMAEIKSILKKNGLPLDLAYLPHIESSFNLKAYSKVGASGIWQFTRSTGKRFLTINHALDERQDPIRASHAAIQLLKTNFELLGNWPLAITAYNYGTAGMLRAKMAYLRYEEIFLHYTQGYFKFASRNFYSEFLAAKRVAKRLEKDPDIQLDKPLPRLRFRFPEYISVHDLCKHFNISLNAVKKMNPALRHPILQGDKYIPKDYTIHLPVNNRNRTLLATIPSHFFHKKQKPTLFYRVQKGDTAGKVARTHKISLAALRKANSLKKNNAIFVGQSLRIPRNTNSNNQVVTLSLSQQKLKKRYPTKTRRSDLPTLTDNKKSRPVLKKTKTISNQFSAKSFDEKRFDYHMKSEEDFFNVYNYSRGKLIQS